METSNSVKKMCNEAVEVIEAAEAVEAVKLIEAAEVIRHTDPNWLILSNKYNPGQPIQKPGFWLSSRPFCIRTTFIWVHQGPPVIVLIFF